MGLEVLYLLIPASVLLAGLALAFFVWAIHTGQFDDLETPALRVLFDDGTAVPPLPSALEASPHKQPAAQSASPRPDAPALERSQPREDG